MNKIFDKLFSAYMFISAFASLLFLIVLVIDRELSMVAIVPVFFSILLISATIYYNVKSLLSYSITRSRHLVNICSSFLQSIYIVVNGFQFKYNQGIKLLVYGRMNAATSEFKYGVDFDWFSYLINVTFLEVSYTSIGIDFFAISIMVFYLFQYKNTKHFLS